MSTRRTYSSFGLRRSLHQLGHAFQRRRGSDARVSVLHERLSRDEARIEEALGRRLEGLDVLEIGPGQRPFRARALALSNRVTALDLDALPRGLDPLGHLRLLRRNGAGRLLKTVGRRLLGVDRAEREAWQRALGTGSLPEPTFLEGDIGTAPPRTSAFDLVVSWSVFEHLPDPMTSLRHAMATLRPGGVLYLGIHLYTAINGHHDIRAFSGRGDRLPAWGHLRPDQAHRIHPGAYLNRWRLERWRGLFRELCPGHQEFCERYEEERHRALLTPTLRAELADYSEEELLTVEVYYLWRKPQA